MKFIVLNLLISFLVVGCGGDVEDYIKTQYKKAMQVIGRGPSAVYEGNQVVNVTSDNQSGSYKEGAGIDIKVYFSDTVILEGTIGLKVKVGSRAKNTKCRASGGQKGNYLICTYVVEKEDSTYRLTYAGADALVLGGNSSLKSEDGSDVNLALPLPGEKNSLSQNRHIRLDTMPPKVVKISTEVSDEKPFSVGGVIRIDLTFSEGVKLEGLLQLTLGIGVDRKINCLASGGSSTTISCVYSVQSGENTNKLDLAPKNSIVLASGSLKDQAGNEADLTSYPGPGQRNSLSHEKIIVIDTIAPKIVEVLTKKEDGTYSVGEKIEIRVIFNEFLDVEGAPQLEINVKDEGKRVSCHGSTTLTEKNELICTYIVEEGDQSAKLAYLSTEALKSFSGRLIDFAGNEASFILPSPGGEKSLSYGRKIAIDTTSPRVNNIRTALKSGTYVEGQAIPIKVNFSVPVVIKGNPKLSLNSGATVDCDSSSKEVTVMNCNYVVGKNESTSRLDYVGADSLTLPTGASIKGKNGTSANLILENPGHESSLSQGGAKILLINTATSGVKRVFTTKPNGTYKAGDTINIQVEFEGNVKITGDLKLTLELGEPDGSVICSTDPNQFVRIVNCLYTVELGDYSLNLDYEGIDSLLVSGGSVVSEAGSSVDLKLPGPGAVDSLSYGKDIKVGTPESSVARVYTAKMDGVYGTGEVIDILVEFDGPVLVTGNPKLDLNLAVTQLANYVSGSGSKTLIFTYRVGEGNAAARLDYTGTDALSLFGGTIKDFYGQDSDLTLPPPSFFEGKIIGIETLRPRISKVDSSDAGGIYKPGDLVSIEVVFDKALTVAGTPKITLALDGQNHQVDFDGFLGGNTLVFIYEVLPGHNSSNLSFINTSALEGDIYDTIGNPVHLTLPLTGDGKSLSEKDIIIDSTSPSVLNVTSDKDDGKYTVGEQINIQIKFSETVNVSGKPTLLLDVGSKNKELNYSTGSRTDTLTFVYTVEEGEFSEKLEYRSKYSLLTPGEALITDDAENMANKELPSPGEYGSLSYFKNITINAVIPEPPTNLIFDNLWSTKNMLSPFSWTPSISKDIVTYQVALGSTPGGKDVLPWFDIGPVTNYEFNSLSLTECTPYYVSLRAQNDLGNFSSIVTSKAVGFDSTPPEAPKNLVVQKLGDKYDVSNPATWDASTDNCGLSHYGFKIGTTPGGNEVMAEIDIGKVTSFRQSDISLIEDKDYYITLVAYDISGYSSQAVISDSWRVFNSRFLDLAASNYSIYDPLNPNENLEKGKLRSDSVHFFFSPDGKAKRCGTTKYLFEEADYNYKILDGHEVSFIAIDNQKGGKEIFEVTVHEKDVMVEVTRQGGGDLEYIHGLPHGIMDRYALKKLGPVEGKTPQDIYTQGCQAVEGRKLSALSLGFNHNCFLSGTGVVKCWGDNKEGQLGLGHSRVIGDETGEMGSNLVAVNFKDDLQAIQIARGTEFGCALMEGNKKVMCWGKNNASQLGFDTEGASVGSSAGDLPLSRYFQFDRDISSIVLGEGHGCALLSDKKIKCWGKGGNGRLGYGSTQNRFATEAGLPDVDLGKDEKVLNIGLGTSHSCALLQGGNVKCWGKNNHGQLGYNDIVSRGIKAGEMGDSLAYLNFGEGRKAKYLAVGKNHNCAYLDNNTLKCWGLNDEGQLGQGDTDNRGNGIGESIAEMKAVDLGHNEGVIQVASSGRSICILFMDGKIKCWGKNGSGQLGLGDKSNRGDGADEMGDNLPFIDLGTDWQTKNIWGGSGHFCAHLLSGKIKCWGFNQLGQLGIGTINHVGSKADDMGDNLKAIDLGQDGN